MILQIRKKEAFICESYDVPIIINVVFKKFLRFGVCKQKQLLKSDNNLNLKESMEITLCFLLKLFILYVQQWVLWYVQPKLLYLNKIQFCPMYANRF